MQKFTKIETELNGEPYTLKIKSNYVVCYKCRGNGVHVNPAIDGNGLSDHLADDPDFMDGYMSGVHDVTCEACHGERVLLEPDLNSMTMQEEKIYNDYQEQCIADYLESEGERRMGA